MSTASQMSCNHPTSLWMAYLGASPTMFLHLSSAKLSTNHIASTPHSPTLAPLWATHPVLCNHILSTSKPNSPSSHPGTMGTESEEKSSIGLSGQQAAMVALIDPIQDTHTHPTVSHTRTHSTSRFRMARPEASTSATLDTMGS
jgi:hypothetical protein